MAFTFWQRFYPSLLLSCLAWAGIGYWAYVNTDPALDWFQFGALAFLVGLFLQFMLINAAIEQAKFRIHLNRMNRFRQQAARGHYTDRIRL
jgi:hypothetical protein